MKKEDMSKIKLIRIYYDFCFEIEKYIFFNQGLD
jgi:hypothetical protein